jgi:hypothetical protein
MSTRNNFNTLSIDGLTEAALNDIFASSKKEHLDDQARIFVASGHGHIRLDKFMTVPEKLVIITLTNEGRALTDFDAEREESGNRSFTSNILYLWVQFCMHVKRQHRDVEASDVLLKRYIKVFERKVSEFYKSYNLERDLFLNVYFENDIIPEMALNWRIDPAEWGCSDAMMSAAENWCPPFLQTRGILGWREHLDKALLGQRGEARNVSDATGTHTLVMKKLRNQSPSKTALLSDVLEVLVSVKFAGVTTLVVATCMELDSDYLFINPQYDYIFKDVMQRHSLQMSNAQEAERALRLKKRRTERGLNEGKHSASMRGASAILRECVEAKMRDFQMFRAEIHGDLRFNVPADYRGFDFCRLFYKKFWFGHLADTCTSDYGANFLIDYRDLRIDDEAIVNFGEMTMTTNGGDRGAIFFDYSVPMRNEKGEPVSFGFETPTRILGVDLYGNRGNGEMYPFFYLPSNRNARQLLAIFSRNQRSLNLNKIRGDILQDEGAREQIFNEWRQRIEYFMGPDTLTSFADTMYQLFVKVRGFKELFVRKSNGKIDQHSPHNHFLDAVRKYKLFQDFETVASAAGLVGYETWPIFYKEKNLVRNKTFPYVCPLEYYVANFFLSEEGDPLSLLDICRQRLDREVSDNCVCPYSPWEGLSLEQLVEEARKEWQPDRLYKSRSFRYTTKLCELPARCLLSLKDAFFLAQHILEKFRARDYLQLKKQYSICNVTQLIDAYDEVIWYLSELSQKIGIEKYYKNGQRITIKYILDIAFYTFFLENELRQDPPAVPKKETTQINTYSFPYLLVLDKCLFENLFDQSDLINSST